jgi:quercetin dioxygenase-like cupin family protein
MFRSSLLTLAALAFAIPTLAADPAAKPAQPAPPGPGFHEVAYSVAAGAGDGKEVKMLLDTPHLKLASITLRKGTVLAEHATPMPVTITAISGAGHVVAGGTKLRIEPGKMVALAPNVPHSVAPDAGTDLIVLVHHLKHGPMGPGQGNGRGRGPGPGPDGKGPPAGEKPRVPAR